MAQARAHPFTGSRGEKGSRLPAEYVLFAWPASTFFFGKVGLHKFEISENSGANSGFSRFGGIPYMNI